MTVLAILILIGGWTSWVDAREYRIPDEMVTMGLLCAVGLCFAGAVPWRTALGGLALAGGQTGLVKAAVGDRFGWGDVKYSLALGAMLGPGAWLTALLLSAAGALASFFVGAVESRGNPKDRLPFAPFLTAGAISAFLAGGSLS